MSGSSDKPLIMLPGPKPAASGGADERRNSPRFTFTASALVFDVRTQTRIAGRSGDLSDGGCYIDTISPFPVGTMVRVCLEHAPHRFEALAVVTYAPASMGMGLAFSEIKPENRAILREWVAELSGEQLLAPEAPATVLEAGLASSTGNLRQVVTALINLMIRRRVISEKDGAELLQQLLEVTGQITAPFAR